MTIQKLRVIALACCLSTTALAGSMGPESNFNNGHIVATLSLGPAWARPGESQNLTLQPDITKAYIPLPTKRTLKLVTTAEGTDSFVSGELFLGLRSAINSVVEGQLGVAFGASSKAKLRGSVWEDTDPHFNNYTYSYGVRNRRVALKSKVLYDPGFYEVFPYVSGSVGVSYNNSSGWTIKPKIIEEVPAPIFTNSKTTQFSFSGGIGLEAVLDDCWRLALGYEFVSWGMSSIGPALGQTIGNKGPSISSLRAHELLVSISYVA